MSDRPTLMERAFQLARLGQARSVAEMAKILNAEGYQNAKAQLESRSLRAQLKKLWDVAARDEPEAAE